MCNVPTTLLRALAVLLVLAGVARAQAPTGVVTGRVHEPTGEPIVDATVRFVSASLTVREARTNAGGRFAMTGLDPGRYDVRVSATGHRSARLASVEVTPGLRASVEIGLHAGDPAEWGELDRSKIVRVDSSASATLSAELLAHVPFERRHAITEVPDYLPGVARGSAYGSAAGTSTVRRVDGIDLTDPLDGSAWTSYVATAARQISVRAAGAGAAEGGFSNALVDVVTEAGGNRLSGLFDALVTTDGLASDNLTEEQLMSNPRLAGRDVLTRSADVSAMVGGALQRDRAHLHAAFGYAQHRRDPYGPRTRLDETTPRLQSRFSFVPGPAQTIAASVLFDRPSVEGSAPPVVSGVVGDDVADRLSGQTIGARLAWQRPLTERFALTLSYGLLSGSRDLEPASPVPGRLDVISGGFSGSQGLVHDSSRQRHVVSAHVTRDMTAAGHHVIQAGGELEVSRIDEATAFVDNQFFVDFAGRPNLLVEWAGDNRQGRSRRESVFVEDTWTPASRLTVNLGVRADLLHGSAPGAGEVYSATTLQPRAGATVDVSGGGRTVARAHYGVYADPLYFSHYDRATPGTSPLVTFELLANGSRREIERSSTPIYRVDPDLRHPSIAETSFGVDQRLSRGARVGVTGVFRDLRNVVDARFPDARWVALSRPGLSNRAITVYRWANRLATQSGGVIGNVDGAQYLAPNGTVIGTAEAGRMARAIVVHGRLDDERQRWTVLAGVTLSRVEGTLDNTFESGIGRSSQFESASAALVNVDGRATETPEREYTVLATARVPWVRARVSAVYIGQDGRYYDALRQFGNETLDFPLSESGRRVLLEARGARALEMDHRLDLRVEYGIGFGTKQITAYVDLTNVLNRATVLRAEDLYPLASAGGSGIVVFDAPLDVGAPRQIFIGGRLRF